MLWLERFNAARAQRKYKDEAKEYGYERRKIIDELLRKIDVLKKTIDDHEEKSVNRESEIRSLTDRLTQINNISKW